MKELIFYVLDKLIETRLDERKLSEIVHIANNDGNIFTFDNPETFWSIAEGIGAEVDSKEIDSFYYKHVLFFLYKDFKFQVFSAKEY